MNFQIVIFGSKSCQIRLPPSQVGLWKIHTPWTKAYHYIKAAWPHSSTTNFHSLKKTSYGYPNKDQEGQEGWKKWWIGSLSLSLSQDFMCGCIFSLLVCKFYGQFLAKHWVYEEIIEKQVSKDDAEGWSFGADH